MSTALLVFAATIVASLLALYAAPGLLERCLFRPYWLVRKGQYDTLVKSVFHSKRFASEGLVDAMAQKFQDRTWKKGVLRTLRGTVSRAPPPLPTCTTATSAR